MKAMFQVKYIHITWADKYTALSIKESTDIIPIDFNDNNQFYLEAITYSKINKFELGQIAFHLLDESNDFIPSFKISSSEKINLLPVLDNATGKTWWVEGSKWSKSKKHWHSEIFRSPGEVILKIGGDTCIIYISSSSFSFKELELYLQDFRNDFWYLILNETNYIQTTDEPKKPKSKVLDVSSVEYIDKFIEFATRILKNPKKELREIQLLQDYKKLRPVPRTFMEIATKGHPKLLTSRGYRDTYNVAENKYIYYIVCKVCILLKNLIKITNYTSNIQLKKIEEYQERLLSYSNIKTIDKEVVENEINELKKQLNDEMFNLNESLKNQNHEMNIYPLEQETIFVRLEKRTNHENELIYFGKAKNKLNDTWINFNGTKYENSFYMFSFDKDIFDDKLKSYNEYKILGYIQKEDLPRENGGYKLRRNFRYITNIKLINSKIKNKIESNLLEIQNLIASNWQRPLTHREREEQDYEKESLQKTQKLSQEQQELSSLLTKKFTPLSSKVFKIKKQLEDLKIEQDSYFPNSMTFIQNPNYQGANKLYKEIMELSGLDENLFVGLQEIDKIGILNISLIYERWCLLQIIKILIDTYNFLPEERWKCKLVDQTLNTGKNIKLNFENQETQRTITLWYEKELENGKRPDFVLDVRSVWGRNANEHRLVLDAKFHENINDVSFGGISTVINNLYNKKNYSENKKNSVYILHPSKNSVPIKKTPQKWARNSYYGEVSMFDWDTRNPDHQYGAILLSPIIRSGNSLDDLHRLIGMFLQYGIEDNSYILNDDNIPDPMVKEKIFCLVCGSDKYRLESKDTKNGKKHWVICTNCHHFTIYNYCANCKNRLIKNGDYWSYHSTQALEPTNVKCPSCGDLL